MILTAREKIKMVESLIGNEEKKLKKLKKKIRFLERDLAITRKPAVAEWFQMKIDFYNKEKVEREEKIRKL
ncbi:MAG: hypothetical protein Q7J14_02185, partial [Candidatus Magasanikbacteria bacterium]|nr:hypothetical protein [Candidatus Magasanikbacteria bacterium]